MNIYFIVTIDTECDKSVNWRVKQPLSFINITAGLPNCLQLIFDKYSIKPTYLLSPEVISNNSSSKYFKSILDRVELGTHMHSEFIEPMENPLTDNTDHFQSDFHPIIEKHKLQNLTNIFIEKFGFRPKSFRAGRFGISMYTLKFLEKLRYDVDSSVTPFMWWHNSKSCINFLGVDPIPYHPLKNDFRKRGRMKIIEMPVTIINPKITRIPKIIQYYINPHNRYQNKLLSILFGKNMHPVWLRPTYSDVPSMMRVVEYMMKKNNKENLFLCMMFHSNEYAIGTSPYSMTKNKLNKLTNRLDFFIQKFKQDYEFLSIGLSEVKKYFKN